MLHREGEAPAQSDYATLEYLANLGGVTRG